MFTMLVFMTKSENKVEHEFGDRYAIFLPLFNLFFLFSFPYYFNLNAKVHKIQDLFLFHFLDYAQRKIK